MKICNFINMKTKQMVLLSLGLILALLASSCKSDMRNEQEFITELSGDYVTLEVPISIVNHDAPSPSLASLRGVTEEDGDFDQKSYGSDPLNENKIDKIDLFLIESGSLKGHYSSAGKSLELDTAKKSVKAKVAKSLADQLEGKPVEIFMIANATQSDFSTVATYEALKKLVQDDNGILSPDPQADGKVALQKNFLMDGTITSTLTWGDNTTTKVATVKLRRAASKIRVRVNKSINVVDLQNGVETKYVMVDEPAIKLVHYTEKGTLIKSDAPYQVKATEWKDESAYRTMPLRTFAGKDATKYPKYNGDFYAAIPFYTYENDWSSVGNQSHETYVIVRVKLRPVYKDGKPYYVDAEGKVVPEGTAGSNLDPGRDYFYRLPINFRKAMDGVPTDKLNKLERNHLYDIYTTIGVLGSIDEGKPVDVNSNVAVQEWNKADKIDGTIEQAHFLVIKEHNPLMPNTNIREVGYISSTPVTTTITKAYYQYYDLRGIYYRVEYASDGSWKKINEAGIVVESGNSTRGAWDGAAVSARSEYLEDGALTIEHAVPNNYVPFYIEFTVKQDSPGTLEDKVVVTQYPPRFVTGNESPGLWNGSEKSEGQSVYADFRHQTPLGTLAPFSAIGSTKLEAQGNEIFSRVSTVVPQRGEIIGVAVDASGKTKSDEQSNKMISPEFIISSQYGMSQGTEQRTNNARIPADGFSLWQSFAQGYGPHSGRSKFKWENPYQNNYTPSASGNSGDWFKLYAGLDYYNRPTYDEYQVNILNDPYQGNENGQLLWRTYTSAEDRCYKYFEGEYGVDGDYVENYIDTNGTWQRRTIHKTFKYKGHWRIPTLAEVEMINRLQQDSNSTVKGLMFGSFYWTAEKDKAYEFAQNRWVYSSHAGTVMLGRYTLPKIFVRCVFDTFGLDDKGANEVRR
ncbi:hypothetical protein [Porphyromonas levii]|uniref:fimbrial tip adhesin FimD n=1 Tax=Porphyromonas levii TaxID=28114 RepID=UPI001BA49CD5|nr:hypothetical protein [Porphyromonas levii]MBR8802805.1 hypothetical protein [Porphyromonas levii]